MSPEPGPEPGPDYGRDFARSDDPQVQAQLDRLASLSIPQGRLGLETIRALLARLGNPHRDIPPAFHVAGTNGKGSTCAYLRAMLEAQGHVVHTATKPHLVRYNERIRIAGRLIDDRALASLLGDVLDAGSDLAPSFFEVTTAATFLAFSRIPADACVIEVGLGGRFDATNVLVKPAVCGIATLGIDHERFLLVPEAGTPAEPLARIAFEKAGIARPDTPLVTMAYPEIAAQQIVLAAQRVGADLSMRGENWSADTGKTAILYRDSKGQLSLPLPAMAGTHQADNAALAAAMLRHQCALEITPEAMARGIRQARWPARLQRLGPGPLSALAPGRDIWLDGGHNADAGVAIARHFAKVLANTPANIAANIAAIHLVIGMQANRDPQAILGPLNRSLTGSHTGSLASITAVPIRSSRSHRAGAYGKEALWASDVETALAALPDDGLPVLIAGSLYLAGEVLRSNHEVPQ